MASRWSIHFRSTLRSRITRSDLSELFGGEQLLLGFVQRLGAALHLRFDLLPFERSPLLGGVVQIVLGEKKPEEILTQTLQIPFGGRIPREIVAAGIAHRILCHLQELVVKIDAVQHLSALGIDDVPLLVHYIVVVQDVAASCKVFALQPFLRLFDGAGKDLRVDGLIVGKPETLHHRKDPLRAEQPQQIVLKRKEETGFAGVSLPSRTSAELVVDPPRLVALGADDEKTADLHHLLVFRTDLLLIFFIKFPVDLPRLQHLLGDRNRRAHGKPDDLVRIFEPFHFLFGEEFGVAPPSIMSVPRPAMLVEMVTLPGFPAMATISASFS